MKCSFFKAEDSSKHLFDAQCSQPVIGQRVYFSNNSLPRGGIERFRYEVVRVDLSINLGFAAFECMDLQEEKPARRFEEAIQYIQQNLQGELNGLKDASQSPTKVPGMTYTLTEAQVYLKEITDVQV